MFCTIVFSLTSHLYSAPDSFSVIRTEHFDFIYPPESEESARYLAQYADGLYDRLCDLLNFPLKRRFSVTITPDSDTINSYCALLPRIHIVLFDAFPPDSFLLLGDYFLWIFYHELTHAFTFACLSSGLDIAALFLGDSISPNLLYLSLFFQEGFTVTFESLNGQGRLNNPIFRQVVSQAKVNGTIPHWSVLDSYCDLYDYGNLLYYFGGSFCDYLRRTYGQDALSAFIVTGNYVFEGAMLKRRFFNSFGISIEDAWEDFKESIVVPPFTEWTEVTHDRTKRDVSSIATADASAAGGFSGIVYYDQVSNAVYALPDGETDFSKATVLFRAHDTDIKLSLSPDGRYMLVTGTIVNDTGKIGKRRVRMYDMLLRTFTGWNLEHYREAAFIRLADGSPAIAAVRTEQLHMTVEVFAGTDFSSRTVVTKLPHRQYIINLCPGRDGSVAFLTGNGLHSNAIAEMTVDPSLPDFGTTKILSAQYDRISCIKDLTSFRTDDGVVTYVFNWSERDSFYRLGMLSSDGSLSIQTVDVSGGIHFPVVFRELLYFTSKDMSFCYPAVAPLSTLPSFARADTIDAPVFDYGIFWDSILSPTLCTIPAKRYNPLSSLVKGMFFPFPLLSSKSGTWYLDPSFLFFSIDSTERWEITLAASFDILCSFFNYEIRIENGSLPLTTVTLSVKDSVEDNLFKDMMRRETVARINFLGEMDLDEWGISLSAETSFGAEWWYIPFDPTTLSGGAYFATVDPAYSSFFFKQNLGFSDSWRSGAMPLEYGNWKISAGGRFSRTFADTVNVSSRLEFSFRLPKILPVENHYPLTLSLPLAVSLSGNWAPIYPRSYKTMNLSHNDCSYNTLQGNIVVSGEISLTPFAIELQKPMYFLPLYIRRFLTDIKYGYHHFFLSSDAETHQYADYIVFSAGLELMPAFVMMYQPFFSM